jgi:hypothetical protein
MRAAPTLLLLAGLAVCGEDSHRFDSLWRNLEERSDPILALGPPWRNDALRAYHLCAERLGEFCAANDAYTEAARRSAEAGTYDTEEVRALAKAASDAWQRYLDARIELERRISEGTAATRAAEVRSEADPGKVAETPPAPPESSPVAEPPASPPTDPTPAPAPAAPQQQWVARQQSFLRSAGAAASAALGPALEAAMRALEAYAAAQGAALAERDRLQAERKPVAAEGRELRLAELARLQDLAAAARLRFEESRREFERRKAAAMRGGPEEKAAGSRDGDRLGIYLEALAGATGGSGEPLGTLAAAVERAAEAGLSSALAQDLLRLGGVDAARAREMGDRLGRLLAARTSAPK